MATAPFVDTSDRKSPHGPRRGWGLRALPTGLVLAALAGVAYWGHHTGWRFVPQRGKPVIATGEERTFWIEEGTRRPGAGRCAEHGLPTCPLCNPELAQVKKPPAPSAADRERVSRALAARERAVGDPTALRRPRVVRFASADAADAAGIDISPAWTGAVTEAVAGSGELSFDPARVTRVTARAPGTAWRVFKQMGDTVRAGDVLALVDAAEVGKAKAELQVALVQVRLRAQAARDLATASANERQRKEAEAALKEAEVHIQTAEQALVTLGFSPRARELRDLSPDAVADRLQRLGLPPDLGTSDEMGSLPGTLLPVFAPMGGVVLRTGTVAGEPVDAAKVLFVVADPRQLRLTVHAPAAEVRWVKVGQNVRFRPDGSATDAAGRVTWVGATADEVTRTVPVWAEVPNPDGTLRASTLGTARVVIREEPDAILVPAAAVHTVAGAAVVFVRDKDYLADDGPKAFHARAIVPGAGEGDNVEVVVGLSPDEIVAVKGSARLADEMRKHLAAGN